MSRVTSDVLLNEIQSYKSRRPEWGVQTAEINSSKPGQPVIIKVVDLRAGGEEFSGEVRKFTDGDQSDEVLYELYDEAGHFIGECHSLDDLLDVH